MIKNSDGPVAQIDAIQGATCDTLGSVSFTANDVYTYTWFDQLESDARSDLEAGNYVVTITDSNACSNLIELTIDDDCVITTCTEPIVDATITESTCGNADGAIMLNVSGNVTYTWTPNVSVTNSASSLAAGIYNIVVADATDTLCSTSIDVIITNSDGPIVSVLSAINADCNMGGSIVVGPATFDYIWSDGFTGNERTDLAAGTFTGTATDANGCTNSFTVIIEDDCDPSICNEPVLTATVTDATCGNNDGAISITVDGNTDVNFSWTPTLSTSSDLTAIPAGLYTVVVSDVDDASCSAELVVLVTNADGPTATISDLVNADCDSLGSVTISSPDTLTYTWADNIVADMREDLAAGAYSVTVSDGSSCTNLLQVIIGDDCNVVPPTVCDAFAGNLDIDLSPVCLADSTAIISATAIGNAVVPNGYSTIYVLTYGDSIVIEQVSNNPSFTIDSLGTYRIHTLVYDTTSLDLSTVVLGTTTAADVNALLIQGGGSICASLDLLGASTLVYDCGDCEARAGSLTLTVAPVICIDTTTTTTVELTAMADGNQVVPDGFELKYVLTSTSSFFVEEVNSTPDFTVDAIPGIYTIHALVYDTLTLDTDTLDITGTTQVFGLNSMLIQGGGTLCGELDLGGAMITLDTCIIDPNGDPCTVDIIIDDVVNIVTDDCDMGTEYCIPMAFVDIMTSYAVEINGDLVNQFVGCDFDSIYSYALTNLMADTLVGPYFVEGWIVGDSTYSGNVATVADLLDSMNIWNPQGQWMLDTTSMTITGGEIGNAYGILTINDLVKNKSVILDMDITELPNGTSVDVMQGSNIVVITDLTTGCVDSVLVNVSCNLPDPVSGDTLYQEVVLGETGVICIDFDSLTTVATFINDCENNSSPAVDFMIVDTTTCVQFTGEAIGLDTACYVACDALGNCDTTILIVEVIEMPSTDIDITIEVGSDTLICLDGNFSTPIDTIFNACPENSDGNAAFMIDTTECIGIIGLSVGIDTACIVICSDFVCDTINVTVTTIPEGGLQGPIAVNNDTMTIINTPVTINVILNDTLNGENGTIAILDDPSNGSAVVTVDNEVIYTPDPAFCGQIDSFTYVLTTTGGVDTATVTVNVLCEELTVFNGFSPNGDDVNETFTILGIDRFPNARVYVYNRWGNQVYFKDGGYLNISGVAFDGTWEGQELPDGTYFYMIDTNDGENFTGFVQIHR